MYPTNIYVLIDLNAVYGISVIIKDLSTSKSDREEHIDLLYTLRFWKITHRQIHV
jgi:hypothetical protein